MHARGEELSSGFVLVFACQEWYQYEWYYYHKQEFLYQKGKSCQLGVGQRLDGGHPICCPYGEGLGYCLNDLHPHLHGSAPAPTPACCLACLQRCAKDFYARCSGPALAAFSDRLEKAGRRATSYFHKEYNDRLFVGECVRVTLCRKGAERGRAGGLPQDAVRCSGSSYALLLHIPAYARTPGVVWP